MATPVELPQLGNTVEECLIAKWRARPGDVVAAGEVVADIETDKTTFELTAPASGTVLATFFDEGALVPVFTTILVIGTPGEPVEDYTPAGAAAATVSRPVGAPRVAGAATPESPQPPRTSASYSPRASRFAAAHRFRPQSIAGSGPGGRVLERDVRRAYELAMEQGTLSRASSDGPAAVGRTAAPIEQPVTGLRATIALRMRESVAATAQYTLHASADASGLLAVRSRFKERASGRGADVTIGDLVMFCTIRALGEVPDLNVEYLDGRIVRHEHVHLAFAADTPRGLLAPVVRMADRLTIEELAARIRELSAQAVRGTIAADDLAGGTFTVSNLGVLGIESFTPLLNPPQVAILGVGAIQPRVVRKPGKGDRLRMRETSARRAMALAESIDVVDAIGLSLTCDHQVIDGAPAARFLQVVRKKLESVERSTGDPSNW
jgi:pyruvate dehydrogenase E2 component (dihydrolipoyllysine-residue acetyltransferase)